MSWGDKRVTELSDPLGVISRHLKDKFFYLTYLFFTRCINLMELVSGNEGEY